MVFVNLSIIKNPRIISRGLFGYILWFVVCQSPEHPYFIEAKIDAQNGDAKQEKIPNKEK
jgi:hypothetical protein